MYRNPVRTDDLNTLDLISAKGSDEVHRSEDRNLCAETLLANPDALLRLQALRQLDAKSIKGYTREVERAMYFDPEADVRVQAAFALSKETACSPIPLIIEATLCGDPQIAAEGLKLLGRLPEQVSSHLPLIIERYKFIPGDMRAEVVKLVASTYREHPEEVIDFLRECVSRDSSYQAMRVAAGSLARIDSVGSVRYFAGELRPSAFPSEGSTRAQVGALIALAECKGDARGWAISACEKYLERYSKVAASWFPEVTKHPGSTILPRFISEAIGAVLRPVTEPFFAPFRERVVNLSSQALQTLSQFSEPKASEALVVNIEHSIAAVSDLAHQAVRLRLDQGAQMRWHLLQVWNGEDFKSRQVVGELISDLKIKSLLPAVIKSLGHKEEQQRELGIKIIRSLDTELHDKFKGQILRYVSPGRTHRSLEVLKLIGELHSDFTSQICGVLRSAINNPDKWHEDVVLEMITLLGEKGGAESIDVLMFASERGNGRIQAHASEMHNSVQRRFK